MSQLVYLNGDYLPAERATVSVLDRGFVFGDGVYEVWRVVRGRLFEAERHRARLRRGLAALRIDAPPESTGDGLDHLAGRLLVQDGLTDGEAIVYVEVTRGAAPRTHGFPPAGTAPTVFAYAARFAPNEKYLTDGVRVLSQPDVRWLRCDVKTIQLLPNVLARQAATEAGAAEAVFVRDGVVTEGTHTNVVAILGGELRTHPVGPHVLPGITRAVVLEIAHAMGVPVREEPITASQVDACSELMLVGTTTDVTPIVEWDGRAVGGGTPGPMARALYERLRKRMDERS